MKVFSNIVHDINFRLPNDQSIIDEFKKSIFDNRFFISKNALIKNSKKVAFTKPEWDKNPFRFALDQYDNSLLANVILLVNDISSYVEFTSENLQNIIVPDKNTIYKLVIKI